MSKEIASIGLPIQFDRMYQGPIDKYDIFDSYADAVIYAQGNLAYPGQILGVKGIGIKREIYVINENRTLSNAITQRDNVNIVLEADKWIGLGPYTQTVAIPYLQPGDNAVVNLASSGTINHVNAIVQSKIGEIVQQQDSIVFYANGDMPEIDIPLEVVIGSIVSAVEIPNNVNDNTNTTVVVAKANAWEGTLPPYYQTITVDGVRPDSNGTVTISPDSAYAEKLMASSCGLFRMDQKNNAIVIGANFSKPTRDLEILVVWGDNIVVCENTDYAEDVNTTAELILKRAEWSESVPYTQTVRVEGIKENSNGQITVSHLATVEEAQASEAAELQLIEQGDGYLKIIANSVKPEVDIPVKVIYGANINIVPAPDYVGEANKHVDTTAFASKWIKTPDGYEQYVDVANITQSSIGTMGIRQYSNNLQIYAAAQAKIEIKSQYDNKVLLVAKGIRPNVNIPLCFVFGRNVNVIRYQELTGKIALSAEYIPYDDSKIGYELETVQQVLERLKELKIDYADIVDNLTTTDKLKPLSANMGKYLEDKKINFVDIVDNLTTTDKLKPLSANMGKKLNDEKIFYTDTRNNLTSTDTTKPLSANMGKKLNEEKIFYADIVDNLTSVDKLKPLSANMGKYLQDKKIFYTDTVNTLTSTSTNLPLSANMGKRLDEIKIDYTDTVNTLTSTSTTLPLSANMGRSLNNKYTQLQQDVGSNVLRIQTSDPGAVAGKRVLWINA